MQSSKNTLNHIAFIMDGNGTWSKNNNLQKKEGHKKGLIIAKKVIGYALDENIKNVTLYALSNENLTRSKLELKNLFELFFYSFINEKNFLIEKSIKIKFIGNLSKLPKKIRDNALLLEKQTCENKLLNLFVALNYGGKQDINQAAEKYCKSKCKNKNFESFLFSKDLPEVDLLIRTGGYRRLSNFVLWQLSYAELYFTNTLWPNFNKRSFKNAINWYKSIDRKFGKSKC